MRLWYRVSASGSVRVTSESDDVYKLQFSGVGWPTAKSTRTTGLSQSEYKKALLVSYSSLDMCPDPTP